ncbi:hypothetical protein FGG08_007388 [Glutinoglossum americanum]|uniref:Protein kinase domain-containing protein n=1 Tax=Glutinoglossum americanum TaxID=1670608 RepID=A0A9P8HZK0_9PEZI|nr:hypothetical protein FGG08_007388 [Glutinoglossum americanum]
MVIMFISCDFPFVSNVRFPPCKWDDLEKGRADRRAAFAHGEPMPFESRATLGPGGFGQSDKIFSVMSHKEYARKRVRRKAIFEEAQMSAESYANKLEVLKRLRHLHTVGLVGSYTGPNFLGLIMSPVADYNLSEYFSIVPESLDKTRLLLTFGRLDVSFSK